MKYKEATNYIQTPSPTSVYIKEWKGNVVLQGLTLKEVESDLTKQEIIIKSFVNPVLDENSYKILFKKSAMVLNRLYEICLLKSGLHSQTEIFCESFFRDNVYLKNKFFMAKQLSKNIWGKSETIEDMYNLENIYWLIFFKELNKNAKNK